jgi:predicted PurR-regulated permease PerM
MSHFPLQPLAAHMPWAVRGLFAIALVFALREAGTLLAPVAIAVVLTFLLAPAVRYLRRRGIPEVVGAGLLVLVLLSSVVPLAASLAQPASLWWDKAPTTVAQLLAQFDRMRAAIPGLGPPPAAQPAAQRSAVAAPTAAASAPPPADPVKERLASEGVALTGVLLERSLVFVISAAATVILLYFLLASEHWMLSRCVEALPRRRARALLLCGVRAAQREIGRYLFALGCINFGAGLITGLALWALGLPNPTLWGVVVAVLNFVPYLGPLISMGLLLLAGLVSFIDLPSMLAPAGAYALIRAIEGNLFNPWLLGRRLTLSPLAVFLSVMFWGWLWGIPGALIAVPVLIAMRSFFSRHRRLRQFARVLEGDFNAPPTLRALLRPRSGLRGSRVQPQAGSGPRTAAGEEGLHSIGSNPDRG